MASAVIPTSLRRMSLSSMRAPRLFLASPSVNIANGFRAESPYFSFLWMSNFLVASMILIISCFESSMS